MIAVFLPEREGRGENFQKGRGNPKLPLHPLRGNFFSIPGKERNKIVQEKAICWKEGVRRKSKEIYNQKRSGRRRRQTRKGGKEKMENEPSRGIGVTKTFPVGKFCDSKRKFLLQFSQESSGGVFPCLHFSSGKLPVSHKRLRNPLLDQNPFFGIKDTR